MKRWVVLLGLLGLVCAAAPAARADVLLKEDFSGTEFKGVGGVYMQGRSDINREDPSVPPFRIANGVLTSSPEGSTAGSDGVSNRDADPASIRFLLLTGDPAWADVSLTTKVRIDAQNTGSFGLVLRAAKKTKPEDPDSWYEFRYTTGANPVLAPEEEAGIVTNDNPPVLQILKVVNGKWSLLAETDISKNSAIPEINAAGDRNEQGATFRFAAKGTLLQGFISLDGTTFTKFLEANDGELKSGLVGLTHYDYSPLFDDLVVETQ